MTLRQKSRPDFTVIIPTYSRSSFVRKSILSALNQKGIKLEILVIDDCSPDDTSDVVKGIKDNRVKYIKNRKRLGTGQNFVKCFKHAKGAYIFTLGDDDMILNDNTLLKVLKVMKKTNAGIGRIGSIAYEGSPNKPYSTQILSDRILFYKPKKNFNIFVKSVDFGLGYFSGVIFDNTRFNKKKLKPKHKCFPDHMCNEYHRIAYDLISKYGMVYIPKEFIVANLSLSLIPRYFNMKKLGRLFFEDSINHVSEVATKEELEEFKKVYLRSQLVLLPNIKYFTDLGNYINVLKKLIELDKSLMYDFKFLLFSASGFLPNQIINLIRSILYELNQEQTFEKLEQYKYFQKIDNLNF